MIAAVDTTVAALRDAAEAMRSVTAHVTDEVRAIETAIQALQAAKCERLHEMSETKAHEKDGASSISTWARRELRQDAGTTRQMVAAGRAFGDLPAIGAAARRGEISFEHVVSLSYSLKHVGVEETRQIESTLLDWSRTCSPSEVHVRIRRIRDLVHADELDEKWRQGMDKRDLSISKTLDGWHLTGFLDIETGAKLKAILINLSVPRDADDQRTASQRRIDALEEMCDSVLEHGLPADNGVRPHITVTVEAATLKRALQPTSGQMFDLDLTPAVLEGFGHVGPMFLQHLMCGAEITPILIEKIGPRTAVLDVGDTRRLATDKQAKAISFRQRGRCASPGCAHPIAHNHHVRWVSRGGLTDLDNLIGLCHKCHLLVHAEQLHITGRYGAGFVFGSGRGSPLHRRAG